MISGMSCSLLIRYIEPYELREAIASGFRDFNFICSQKNFSELFFR